MSDRPLNAVLDELARLARETAAAVQQLREEQIRLRVDLMARMDRLQSRMDSLDEHLTLGLGHSDQVEQAARSVTEGNRLLSERISSLTKLVRMLESRVNQIENRPHEGGAP